MLTNANFNQTGERIGSLSPNETFLQNLPEAERSKRAIENLKKIDHIIILVLENRSFDHMLGYLSLPLNLKGRGRKEVNGLTGDEFNLCPKDPESVAVDNAASRRRVFRLSALRFPVDPEHATPSAVARQMGETNQDAPMGGFVRSFQRRLLREGLLSKHDPGLIMGYYTGDQLPAYDLLSEHFTVCDRWFCSVPSGTWPNRMFLYCGTSNGIITHPKNPPFDYGPEYEKMPEKLIIHVLDKHKVKWRIYSHDFAWMRFFRSFDPGPIAALSRVDKFGRFLSACEKGDLPAVSFIDPNWSDIGVAGEANDDHPPHASVEKSQQLIATIYEALRTGGNNLFKRTLFVITYDEHGGFYDHVLPPSVPKPEPLKTYGVRVPALVISPHVPKRSVSHTLFEHPSIMKTILLRFCGGESSLASQPPRVRLARHLGELLVEKQARSGFPSAQPIIAARASLRAVDGPDQSRLSKPSELALEVAAARVAELARGVPEEEL